MPTDKPPRAALEQVCIKGIALLNVLKAAYGHHYPAGMTELREFEKAIEKARPKKLKGEGE